MSTGREGLGSKCEGMAAVRGQGFDNLKESQAGVGERGAGAMDEPKTAGDFQFGDCDLHQFFAGELGLDGEAGNQRDALPARHETLDRFEARQFDTHVEGRLVVSKRLNHALAEWRWDRVRDEILGPQLADGDLFLLRQRMLRVDDEGDRVGVDGDGVEPRVLGTERKNAELDGSLQKLIGDLAGKGPLHGDADLREIPAKFVEDRKKPEAGVLIGCEGEAATLERAQLFEGGDGFAAQTQEALGEGAQQLAGGGERGIARGSLKKRLPYLLFQFADGVTDGGLGAAHARSGARKTLFFGDGEESFELVEVHKERAAWVSCAAT